MQKSVDGLLREDYNLTNLVMQSPVIMALLQGEDYKLQLINEKGLDFAGQDWDLIKDKPIFETFPELRFKGYEESLKNVYSTGIPYSINQVQINYTGNNGIVTPKYLNITFQPLRNEFHTVIGIIATGVDITEQVMSKKILQESESKYRGLFHSMSQGFCIIKIIFNEEKKPVDFVFVEVNPAFYKLTPHSEVIGKKASSLVKGNFDYWLNIYANVALNGEEIITTGPSVSVAGKHFEIYAYPVGDNLVAVLFTDISERKQNEESQRVFADELKILVQQRTLELQKSNEDLQQFAHIASHDLKEPVRKITSYAELILNDNLPEEVSMNFLRNIYKSSKRMATTIDDILKYSTSDHYLADASNDIDLNEIIKDVCLDLEMKIHEKKAILEAGNLPTIQGSRILIYQLFYNLISNSLKFAKPCIPVTIKISSKIFYKEDKEYTEITVADDGVGFEQEYSQKIFEKFSRLHSKDLYEGTGLGLALCKKITERHSGTITATGILNKGAVFTITLPLSLR